jgi:hypothetical protein
MLLKDITIYPLFNLLHRNARRLANDQFWHRTADTRQIWKEMSHTTPLFDRGGVEHLPQSFNSHEIFKLHLPFLSAVHRNEQLLLQQIKRFSQTTVFFDWLVAAGHVVPFLLSL